MAPVPAYGLERLRTAAADTGATIELIDPYLVSQRPVEAAAAAARRLVPDVIGLGIRVADDCIVVDRLEAPESEPHDLSWLMPEIRRLRRALGEAVPSALVVAGGAAFSAFPEECLSYLELEYGVVGAGEAAFRSLVERVAAGSELDGIPGLVRRGERSPLDAYELGFPGVTLREPMYAAVNGFPVRTRIGCGMRCTYCLTANLGGRHANGDPVLVVDEVEATVAEAARRGATRVPIFFADDELNLPDEDHAIAVLRGLVARKLARRLSWRAYFNPTPFSDELAALVRATNGHVSVTVDTASEPVMARARKPFRRPHLDRLVELLSERSIPADLSLVFGLPGETDRTVAETVAFVRSLPPALRVAYAAGARVYPHTPLAEIARQEPSRLAGSDDPSFFEPVVYSSPVPPRELARRLAGAFRGLPNVRPVGVGFARGPTVLADAYRIVLSGGPRAEWSEVLARAEGAGDYERSPAEAVAAAAQLAVWHGRFDLAAAACGSLARVPGTLPSGLSRPRLRIAGAGYRVLAALDRRARPPAPGGGTG